MSDTKSVLFEVMNRLRPSETSECGLSHIEASTLIAVADRIGSERGVCNAAASTLAKTVRLSEKSVLRGLKSLVDRGVLTRQPGGFNLPDFIRLGSLDQIPRLNTSRTHSPVDRTPSPVIPDSQSGLNRTPSPTKPSLKHSQKHSLPPTPLTGANNRGGRDSASPSEPVGFTPTQEYLVRLRSVHAQAFPSMRPFTDGVALGAIKRISAEVAWVAPELPSLIEGLSKQGVNMPAVLNALVGELPRLVPIWVERKSEKLKAALRATTELAKEHKQHGRDLEEALLIDHADHGRSSGLIVAHLKAIGYRFGKIADVATVPEIAERYAAAVVEPKVAPDIEPEIAPVTPSMPPFQADNGNGALTDGPVGLDLALKNDLPEMDEDADEDVDALFAGPPVDEENFAALAEKAQERLRQLRQEAAPVWNRSRTEDGEVIH